MNLFKKKYSLSILIFIELACFVVLIFGTVYVLKKQNLANEKLNIAINLRYTSFLLADQLRQSSDDLTRMVRTYAATGDSKFEEYFYIILNIRDGKVPRPENYDRIFWDFKLAEETIYRSEDGKRISLNTLMKNAGFSDEEFKLLAEAKRRSDKLVKMEEIAMNAMKGKFKNDKGIFTIIKEPDRELAIQILYSKEYHLAKKDIMKPIDDFLIAIDNRTSHRLTKAQKEIRSLSLASVYLFCFLVLFIPIFILTIYRHQRNSEAELRESEERMRSVLEASPVGISIYDETGQCFVANDSLAEMIGATKEQVLQQNYNEIESWKISGTLDKAKSAIKEDISKRHELIGESTFAQTVRLDCYLVPLSSGRLLFMAHDITERILAEEKLEQQQKSLEELVRKRTVELQKMVNLMAGREVRMAELKKVIAKLRTQLESKGKTPLADDPLKKG
jgi:methyl-accepting chemotaxis protein